MNKRNKKNIIFKILFSTMALISFLILFLGNNYNNYYLLICNSDAISEEDKIYIKKYGDTLDGQVKIIDAKDIKDAAMMCQCLKNSFNNISDKIKAIQIFGTKDDVPAFEIGFEVKMGEDKIDRAYEDFVSDFFYSSFDSDFYRLKSRTAINTIFANKLDVSFVPRWQVSRLPLKKDEISKFIKKYFVYKDQIKALGNTNKIPVVSFSNPILLESPVVDDMGYFIREKIDKQYKYLNNRTYRLYGLLEGYNKVSKPVDGDFIKENLEKENKKQIMDLFINCHGEKDKFIKLVFKSDSLGDREMTSFIDRSNINSILKHNYYTLAAWSCLVAQGLDDQNIIYDILRYKCVDAIVATTIISNNGTNNRVDFEKKQDNNFYLFYYEFFKSLSNNNSRSESFFKAQKAYAESVIKNKDLDDLYQYHIVNILSYHHLGLV
ncbi:MAG: hypothetical protein J6C55_02880 [Oscillospiraceae bacterium]|nr:hypothetical protein [Oscillospiraceae bacterium]